MRRLLPAALASLVVLAFGCASSNEPATSPRQVRVYASAVDVLAKDAGRLVVEEIRPRLDDLRAGRVTPEQFRTEAALWRAKFEAARAAIGRLHPTPALRRANALFDVAFRQYAEAMTAFADASAKPDVGAALDDAIPLATRADHTYDRADTIVQAELRRLGLRTRPTLP